MSTRETLLQLDGSAHQQFDLIDQVLRALRKVNSKSSTAEANKLLKEANELFLTQWTLVWSNLPAITTDCGGSPFCVSVSNAGQLGQYRQGALALNSLLSSAIKATQIATHNPNFGKKLLQAGKKSFNSAVAESRSISGSTAKCS